MEDSIPRKFRLDLQTPAEAAIRAALAHVENLGADEKLTQAVDHLCQALDLVSNHADELINKELESIEE